MQIPGESADTGNTGPTIWFVLNALTVSGGNSEIARLARDLDRLGQRCSIIIMWGSENPIENVGVQIQSLSGWVADKRHAAFQLPLLLWRFFNQFRSAVRTRDKFVFTHYSTLPLAWVLPRAQRLFFVQGLEWMFVPAGPARAVLKWFFLLSLKRGVVLTTNSFLAESLESEGVKISATIPIWGASTFVRSDRTSRDIDVVMVVRGGSVKRLDLYREFCLEVQSNGLPFRLAVISPEADIHEEFSKIAVVSLFLPTVDQMADLYARSKIFLMLSDHEGFSLPPLEAMASGCVPVCRDSGGIRSYLNGDGRAHLIDPLASVASIIQHVASCLNHPDLDGISFRAQETFVAGLARTAAMRDESIRWMLEDLKRG